MNILMISYGDCDYDGRLRELVNTFMQIGEVFIFSMSSQTKFKHHGVFKGGNYLKFIKEAVKYGLQQKDMDVIVVDNRKAILPSRVIQKKLGIKKMILDCRELYFFGDVKHLSGKIGCLIEAPCIKKADIVIAANEERAEIMMEKYKLKSKPIVYENIRKLKYSKGYNLELVKSKYEYLFNRGEHIVISTCGCNRLQLIDVLVSQFANVKHRCRLLLAGWSAQGDIEAIRQILADKKMDNVEILGRLNHDELKYLIRKSDVGIVSYSQFGLNNKYCASGKLFEFLFEGIPVVTTTNPPLQRMCHEGEVGVADDSFVAGIDMVLDNYEYYKKNVRKYMEKKAVENNNKMLVEAVLSRLCSGNTNFC